MMESRSRCTVILAFAALSAALAAPVLASFGGNYEGTLNGDPEATVAFKVLPGSKPGREPRVRFAATGIRLICEDGSQRRMSFAPITTERYKPKRRSFYYRSPLNPPPDYLYAFAGEFRPKGHARGGVSYDEFVEGSGPRCATDGTLQWRAMRDG